MNPPDLFRRLSVLLDGAGIPYMLTGSFASSVYGMGRASQDVDLIIAADEAQVSKLLDLLPANEFYSERDSALQACRRRSMFNLIDNITGLKIDFIFRKVRPFSEEEFRRRRSSLVQDVPLFIASPEDVIVAKLESAKIGGSLRQIEDVTSILKFRKDELDFSYIEKWVNGMALQKEWNEARRAAGLP